MNDGAYCGVMNFFRCSNGACSVEACPAPTTCSGSLSGDLDAAVDGCQIANAVGSIDPVGPILPSFSVGGSAGGTPFEIAVSGFHGQFVAIVSLHAPDGGFYASDPDSGTNMIRTTCCGRAPSNHQLCRFGGSVNATLYPSSDAGLDRAAGRIDFTFGF